MSEIDTDSKEIKFDSQGAILVLLKDGNTFPAEYIAGGGIMVGADPGDYEVSIVIDSATDSEVVIAQRDIAAVLDMDDWRQVEFGNNWMAADSADHPRPQRVRVAN